MTLVFDGSFKETDKWLGYGKSFGNWSFSTLLKYDTLVVSKSNRGHDNYSGKFTQRNGEFGAGDNTVNRALLGSNQASNWPNNTELWSGFSIKLDPTWIFPAQSWSLFWEIQQHATLPDGTTHAFGGWNMCIQFPNAKNPLRFLQRSQPNGVYTEYTISDITPGIWYDIMIHTKLTISNDGFFYVYLRKPGETEYSKIISKTGVNTLFTQTPEQGSYRADSAVGYYRGASTETKSMWLEMVKYGTTRADVEYPPTECPTPQCKITISQ